MWSVVCDITIPYQQQKRTSWRRRWGRGRFPSGNLQTGHSAQPSQHSPGKEALTACRSVMDQKRHNQSGMLSSLDSNLLGLCHDINRKLLNPQSWLWCWPHLLYAKSQYVIHVGRQQCEERVEGPVVGEVSHDDGPQRRGRPDGSPGDLTRRGGQLGTHRKQKTGNKLIEKFFIHLKTDTTTQMFDAILFTRQKYTV